MENALIAALLGLLEGLTEFIPVSSTGHLLLAGHFLGFESESRTFEVVIQLGAILALTSVFAVKLGGLLVRARHEAAARRSILSLFVAFVPAVVVGLLAYKLIKQVLFETPMLIAIMLILGGVVLLWVDRLKIPVRHDDALQVPLHKAFVIGLCQCVAMVPGVSRSGATIVGGLLLGVEKRAAAEFSFLLSLPTMAAAVAYDLYKTRHDLDFTAIWDIAIGFAVAFVAGVVVVRWVLSYVSRRGYSVFGWWRIVVGVLALLGLSLGL